MHIATSRMYIFWSTLKEKKKHPKLNLHPRVHLGYILGCNYIQGKT
jgi:hypothetical protein